MLDLEYYAALIITNRWVTVPKTEQIVAKIKNQSAHIFENEKRFTYKKRRSLEQIEKHSSAIAIEYVLPQVAPEFIMNPHNPEEGNIHPSRPHEYAYDAIYQPTGKTFECKMCGGNALVGASSKFQTMKNNIGLVDYVVAGEMKTRPDCYLVFIHIVADAKTFHGFLNPIDSWGDTQLYIYNHHKAYKQQQCYLSPTIMERTHVTSRAGKQLDKGPKGVHRPSEKEVGGLPS